MIWQFQSGRRFNWIPGGPDVWPLGQKFLKNGPQESEQQQSVVVSHRTGVKESRQARCFIGDRKWQKQLKPHQNLKPHDVHPLIETTLKTLETEENQLHCFLFTMGTISLTLADGEEAAGAWTRLTGSRPTLCVRKLTLRDREGDFTVLPMHSYDLVCVCRLWC